MRPTNLILPAALLCALLTPGTALAQDTDAAQLRGELGEARARIEALERRLQALEARPGAAALNSAPSTKTTPSIERVGTAPADFDRVPEIAVLDTMGAAITRSGQLTGEVSLEYARADRNRAIFRGIELVESVLVGVFDINESRQDVITASAGLRYGLTDRLEFGVRVPFVHRSDNSVLTPIAGSTQDDEAASIDSSAKRTGLGDIEATLRYQITRARNGSPFLVGNLQVVAPTGSNPFDVRRDDAGRALEASTGAGFWGVTPSLTAILPTDPVVLFGTLGYTHNFGDTVDTAIPPVRIVRVKPGDAVSISAGVGIAFNQRTSINLGYAHSWAFGTKTTTELLEPVQGDVRRMTNRARDLQIGRLLFGVTYRVNDNSSFNWGVEVGATDDATDLRTALRIPFTLLNGRN